MKAITVVAAVLGVTIAVWALLQFSYQYMWVEESRGISAGILRIHRLTGQDEMYDPIQKTWLRYGG